MLLNWVICRTIKSYGATKTLYNSRHIWCRGVWFELRTSTLATSRENIFSLNTEGFTVFAILVQAIFPPTSVRIIVQTEIVSIGRDVLCLSAHTSILRLLLTALNSLSLLCTRHVTSPAPVCSSDK